MFLYWQNDKISCQVQQQNNQWIGVRQILISGQMKKTPLFIFNFVTVGVCFYLYVVLKS